MQIVYFPHSPFLRIPPMVHTKVPGGETKNNEFFPVWSVSIISLTFATFVLVFTVWRLLRSQRWGYKKRYTNLETTCDLVPMWPEFDEKAL